VFPEKFLLSAGENRKITKGFGKRKSAFSGANIQKRIESSL